MLEQCDLENSFEHQCHVSLKSLGKIRCFLQRIHKVRLEVLEGSTCLEMGVLSLFGPLSLAP